MKMTWPEYFAREREQKRQLHEATRLRALAEKQSQHVVRTFAIDHCGCSPQAADRIAKRCPLPAKEAALVLYMALRNLNRLPTMSADGRLIPWNPEK
jgi:hypothetical protein